MCFVYLLYFNVWCNLGRGTVEKCGSSGSVKALELCWLPLCGPSMSYELTLLFFENSTVCPLSSWETPVPTPHEGPQECGLGNTALQECCYPWGLSLQVDRLRLHQCKSSRLETAALGGRLIRLHVTLCWHFSPVFYRSDLSGTMVWHHSSWFIIAFLLKSEKLFGVTINTIWVGLH